jgi:hypothetical protein
MSNLDILNALMENPDSYWVLYDLCLLNGWADISVYILPNEII